MSNELYYGDNLEIIKNHIKDESVDLVYLDPPFNSNRDYNVIYDNALAQEKAFGDTWSLMKVEDLEYLIYEGEPQRYASLRGVLDGLKQILFYALESNDKSMYAYLLNMGVRLVELRRVLKDTGSIYLHCDSTASHYLKILLDAIFGKNNFRNEIIWYYPNKLPDSRKKLFTKSNDIVFFYTKNLASDFYFQLQKEERDKPVKDRRIKKENGKKITVRGEDGKPIYDIYTHRTIDSVWKIPMLTGSNKERLRYPTQKPEALLERIIKASCPEGGVVFDPYCGCGTTIAVAHRLGLKWIGIDITYIAIDLIQQRLIDNFYLGGEPNPTDGQKEKARKDFIADTKVFGIPKDLESARKLARETKGDYVRKEFEKWAAFSVGGVYSEKKGADGGVDGSFYIYDIEGGNQVKKTCYIQVKSGKVGERDIRDFDSTLSSFKAPIGIFVTLEEPTKKMLKYASMLPKYVNALGQSYPRITIITIEQILQDDVPDFAVRVTRRAQSVQATQEKLDF